VLNITNPIARRVRDLRLQHALSQEDLAARAKIGRATVIRIERGAPVRPYTVRQIARALGVAPTRLTMGEGE
jgi:transcriptional regulator with XRE-family HTH domain